jgi:hypothetical protein
LIVLASDTIIQILSLSKGEAGTPLMFTIQHSLIIVQGIHFVLHQNWTHILTLVVRAAYVTLRESLPRRSNAVRDLIVQPAHMMLTEPPQSLNLPYSASDIASCHLS